MRIEPKKIMCAIDFSNFSNITISYGRSLASEFQSKLYLCHIVPGPIMVSSHVTPYISYAGVESEHIRHAFEKLEKMAEEFDIDCDILVSAGHPADEIERMARENHMDMILAATHGGSGVKRFLIGSVTSKLLKVLSCPLLVLQPHENKSIPPDQSGIQLNRIMVGCDFSTDSKLAFDYALSLAQEFQTQLHLVHVVRSEETARFTLDQHSALHSENPVDWNRSTYLDFEKKIYHVDDQDKQSLMNQLKMKLSQMVPEDSLNWCSPKHVLLEGQPYKELLDYAEKLQIDMIVLGVRGHSLLEKFLVGSTTDRLISRASCPVLCVRHAAD